MSNEYGVNITSFKTLNPLLVVHNFLHKFCTRTYARLPPTPFYPVKRLVGPSTQDIHIYKGQNLKSSGSDGGGQFKVQKATL